MFHIALEYVCPENITRMRIHLRNSTHCWPMCLLPHSNIYRHSMWISTNLLNVKLQNCQKIISTWLDLESPGRNLVMSWKLWAFMTHNYREDTIQNMGWGPNCKERENEEASRVPKLALLSFVGMGRCRCGVWVCKTTVIKESSQIQDKARGKRMREEGGKRQKKNYVLKF